MLAYERADLLDLVLATDEARRLDRHVSGGGAEGPQRREGRFEPVGLDLEEAGRVAEITKAVFAAVDQLDAFEVLHDTRS